MPGLRRLGQRDWTKCRRMGPCHPVDSPGAGRGSHHRGTRIRVRYRFPVGKSRPPVIPAALQRRRPPGLAGTRACTPPYQKQASPSRPSLRSPVTTCSMWRRSTHEGRISCAPSKNASPRGPRTSRTGGIPAYGSHLGCRQGDRWAAGRVAMQRRPVSVHHAGNKLTPTQLLAIIVP